MIAPELIGHVAIHFKWKGFLFHRECSFNLNSVLDAGLIAGERESKEGRQTMFFTHWIPGEIKLKRNSMKFLRLAWTAASSAWLKATTRSQCFSRKTAIRVQRGLKCWSPRGFACEEAVSCHWGSENKYYDAWMAGVSRPNFSHTSTSPMSLWKMA